MRRTPVCLLTLLFATGCGAQPMEQGATQPAAPAGAGNQMERATMSDDEKTRAIAIGRDYVKQKFPDFSEARKTPVVEDAGEDWQFTYELPIDMLGGAPVVLLSKKDLSVTRAYRTQ